MHVHLLCNGDGDIFMTQPVALAAYAERERGHGATTSGLTGAYQHVVELAIPRNLNVWWLLVGIVPALS